jgi:hypothetical protein
MRPGEKTESEEDKEIETQKHRERNCCCLVRNTDATPTRNIAKKGVLVWTASWREMLFEFSHENAGFEALHFHRKPKQIKVRLPLALSKLSKQHIFQMIKRLIRIIADIYYVKNVPKDLLGQTGEGIGIFELL